MDPHFTITSNPPIITGGSFLPAATATSAAASLNSKVTQAVDPALKEINLSSQADVKTGAASAAVPLKPKLDDPNALMQLVKMVPLLGQKGNKQRIKIEQLLFLPFENVLQTCVCATLIDMCGNKTLNEQQEEQITSLLNDIFGGEWIRAPKRLISELTKLAISLDRTACKPHLEFCKALDKVLENINNPKAILNPVRDPSNVQVVMDFLIETQKNLSNSLWPIFKKASTALKEFRRFCNESQTGNEQIKQRLKKSNMIPKKDYTKINTSIKGNLHDIDNITSHLNRFAFVIEKLLQKFENKWNTLQTESNPLDYLNELSDFRRDYIPAISKRGEPLQEGLLSKIGKLSIESSEGLCLETKQLVQNFLNFWFLRAGEFLEILKKEGQNSLKICSTLKANTTKECGQKLVQFINSAILHWHHEKEKSTEKRPNEPRDKIVQEDYQKAKCDLKAVGASDEEIDGIYERIKKNYDSFWEKTAKECFPILKKYDNSAEDKIHSAWAMTLNFIRHELRFYSSTEAMALIPVDDSTLFFDAVFNSVFGNTDFVNFEKMFKDNSLKKIPGTINLTEVNNREFSKAYRQLFSIRSSIQHLFEGLIPAVEQCKQQTTAVTSQAKEKFEDDDWIAAYQFEEEAKEAVVKQASSGKKPKKSTKTKKEAIDNTAPKTATVHQLSLPYPSKDRRLLALLRQSVSGVFAEADFSTLPIAACTAKPSLAVASVKQQLFSIFCLQSVMDMIPTPQLDPVLKNFLEKCRHFYGHLITEQGMQVVDLEHHPQMNRTHKLAVMGNRLKLGLPIEDYGSDQGTCPLRYPAGYPTGKIDLEAHIVQMANILSKTMTKCSAAAAKAFPSLDTLLAEIEKKEELGKLENAQLSASHRGELELMGERIQKVQEKLEKMAKVTPVTDLEKVKNEALISSMEHLSNLHAITKGVKKSAHPLFLLVFGHMGLVSAQYLAENTGHYLAAKNNKVERGKHNLLYFWMAHRLGDTLTDEWNAFLKVNVGKGSELLEQYCAKNSVGQVSPYVAHISALYDLARNSRLRFEGAKLPQVKTVDMDVIYQEFMSNLSEQIKLSLALVNAHLLKD